MPNLVGMSRNLLPILIIGGAAWFLLSSFKGKQGQHDSYFDLSQLSDRYSSDAVNALDRLYSSLARATDPNTGKPLNPQQIQFLLSQALLETGLFTDSANWNNVNHNNYAGIKAHGNYAAIPGSSLGYANYSSVDSFVEDWLNVLSYNYEPLEGSSLWDYVHKLKQNNYFESDENRYLDNLNFYYTMLADTI